MKDNFKRQNAENPSSVSVIVPVYNAENYIEQCALSLFQQTYKGIEYIFINDASTDNSLETLKSVSAKYPNLKIHIVDIQKNIGASSARIAGINIANSEYTTFCDSDDWLEHTAIEEMVNCAHLTESDVIATPFYINTLSKERILNFPQDNICDLNTIPLNFLHFSLCNKLFKTSLLKQNLPLDGIDCWEDLSIVSRIYSQKIKVSLLNTPFYHYRKHKHRSLTSASNEHQLEERLKYTEFLIEWFSNHNLSSSYNRFLNHLKFTAKIKMLRTQPKQFKRWKSTYPESNRFIMSYKDIPFRYRILFYIADLITSAKK